MPSTFDSFREIEIQHTRIKYCSNHLFIVFRNHNDDNIITKVTGERLDALELTQGVFHNPDFIIFDVTYKCPKRITKTTSTFQDITSWKN